MQFWRKMFCVVWLPALVAGMLLIVTGCGEKGPARQRVSGKITFDGKPLPAGRIAFEPDATANNHGPMGFADVVDGQFDTDKGGKGTVGGPHVVRIDGLSGKPGGSSPVNPLFNTYATKVDLGKGNTTKDFEVPASAAKGLKLSAEPPP